MYQVDTYYLLNSKLFFIRYGLFLVYIDIGSNHRRIEMSKRSKLCKRALFDLLFDLVYGCKEGVDRTKLMERVIELVEKDPECVTRRFWTIHDRYDDRHPEYNIIGGPEDEEGYVSPVHLSARLVLHEVLVYLLDHGGDPNDQFGIDGYYVPAVGAAIDAGSLECTKILHERGVDINRACCMDYGNMADCAAISGNVDLLKFLTSIDVGPVTCHKMDHPPFKKEFSSSMNEAIKENVARFRDD